jgi:hypothetical protein
MITHNSNSFVFLHVLISHLFYLLSSDHVPLKPNGMNQYWIDREGGAGGVLHDSTPLAER